MAGGKEPAMESLKLRFHSWSVLLKGSRVICRFPRIWVYPQQQMSAINNRTTGLHHPQFSFFFLNSVLWRTWMTGPEWPPILQSCWAGEFELILDSSQGHAVSQWDRASDQSLRKITLRGDKASVEEWKNEWSCRIFCRFGAKNTGFFSKL